MLVFGVLKICSDFCLICITVPQFILDSLIIANRGSQASIIVTQPRRLSAISVAARVSAERLEDGSVGYAIRGESKQNKRTKLLFCTTGVLLRRLGSGDRLQGVTHVVVDEVNRLIYICNKTDCLCSCRCTNAPLMATSYCSN